MFLTNSSFDILCLDNAMKYNQFVHSYTRGDGGVGRCMHMCVCVCLCVYREGVEGADGQHKLVLVWGLDQCRVIITGPPLCFRDLLAASFDPHNSCQNWVGKAGGGPRRWAPLW